MLRKFKLKEWEFFFLSFTWGIVMSTIGCVVSLILICLGYRPKRNQYGWYFELGENWGGLDLGCMCVINKNPSRYLLNHEFGHAIQNCFFGPFMVFIGIASAVRYWYREYLTRVKHISYQNLPDYDAIWFEGNATKIGFYYQEN